MERGLFLVLPILFFHVFKSKIQHHRTVFVLLNLRATGGRTELGALPVWAVLELHLSLKCAVIGVL